MNATDPRPTHTPNAEQRAGLRMVLVGADIIGCAASIWLALYLRFGGAPPNEHQLPYLCSFPVLVAWRLYAAYTCGLYDFQHRLTRTDHAFGGIAAALFGVIPGYLLLVFVQLYYAPQFQLSRTVGVLDAALLVVWYAASRSVALSWLEKTGYRVRLLLVGAPATCRELETEIRARSPRLIELVGTTAPGTGTDTRPCADQVVLADLAGAEEDLTKELARWDDSRVELFLFPDLGLSSLVHARVTSIAGLPLVSLSPGHATGPYRIGKPLLDKATAFFGLLLGAPLLAVAAVAIKVTSPGPVLYCQERVGLRGKPFRIYKLRTMVSSAEAMSGPVLASDEDPRVTTVGRWLRRSRIDEIPQLWNILRGDMSLVGPRPERAAFVQQFTEQTPLYTRRLLVKPGLTGLAQIHGGYDSEYTHKLRYDLVYINSLSFTTDLRILIATVQTVLTGRGAL